jgi:hypothetical protein
VEWLINLRNALVHFKPNWGQEQARTGELKETFASRFQLSPFMDEGAALKEVAGVPNPPLQYCNSRAAGLEFFIIWSPSLPKMESLAPTSRGSRWAIDFNSKA